jgi:hypothetical protein
VVSPNLLTPLRCSCAWKCSELWLFHTGGGLEAPGSTRARWAITSTASSASFPTWSAFLPCCVTVASSLLSTRPTRAFSPASRMLGSCPPWPRSRAGPGRSSTSDVSSRSWPGCPLTWGALLGADDRALLFHPRALYPGAPAHGLGPRAALLAPRERVPCAHPPGPPRRGGPRRCELGRPTRPLGRLQPRCACC